MEAAGLAIGIGGLAGLFTTSLEVIHKVDSWKDSGSESRSLTAQFEAHKLRLEKWGQAVGILTTPRARLLEQHHKLLDDQRTCNAVSNLLLAIQDVAGDNNHDVSRTSHSKSKRHSHLNKPVESTRQKLSWTLLNKSRRMAQVEQLSSMVETLYGLVPVDGVCGDCPGNGNTGYGSSNGEPPRARESWVNEYGRILERIEKEIEAETRRDVQKWLLGDHVDEDTFGDHIMDRVEGTCDWILGRSWFQEWASENITQAKVLWVNGPAGFGKSVLCARVIQYLISSSGDSCCLLLPFLKIGKPKRSIHGSQSMGSSIDFSPESIHDIITEIPGCTLILDGLDECNHLEDNHRAKHRDTPAGFLEALLELTQDTATRLLVVSRDEPDIRACFTPSADAYNLSFFEHKITPSDVSSDIALFAEDVVDNALASQQSRPVKKAISQKLADRCNGQFLWIWLHRIPLESDSWRSQQYLEQEIDLTPRGLEVVYERYWTKIEKLPERARNRAISLLRWAVFALRPLRIDEITEALAICDHRNEIDLRDLPERINKGYIDRGILSYCGSLLEVRSSPPGCDAAMMTLQLAHFSVKQYLLHNLPTTSRALQLNSGLKCFEEKTEHMCLAQSCLRYLNCSLIWRRESDLENHPTLGSLVTYATDSWQRHASLGHSECQVVVDLTNQLFDTRGPVWASWIEWVVSNDNRNGKVPSSGSPPSPLYHAAFLGLPKTVDFLIQNRQHNPDEKGVRGQTALGVACENNHHEAAKTLIDFGADLNMADIDGSAPVHVACRNGHVELVRLLLRRNADISLKNSHGWTPLHIASNRGYREICELLLQDDSEIEPVNIHDWTPLHEAAYCGHVTVCEFLLENGAQACLVDHEGRTPLYLASKEGHLHVVRLLLQTALDLSLKNSHGWTPLHAASSGGFLEVCRLLLQSGSEVNSKNIHDWTPLHEASSHGQDRVCSLLLENDAEVDLADHEGRTPLHLASRPGHTEAVRLLLKSHASVDAVTSLDKSTPIHFASMNGHLDIVELLIKSGADVFPVNHEGWTPLHLASNNGYPEIVQLLIESGASACVAKRLHSGSTPLHLASEE
ncbi:hypothetical protein N7512_005706, partial [Penicillium capsulatum]